MTKNRKRTQDRIEVPWHVNPPSPVRDILRGHKEKTKAQNTPKFLFIFISKMFSKDPRLSRNVFVAGMFQA